MASTIGAARTAAAALATVFFVACAPGLRPATAPQPLAGTTQQPLFSSGLEQRVDSLVGQALAERVAPGLAVAIGRHGRLALLKGYGHTDWAPDAPAVDGNTIYDLASLTKVIATTTAAMILEEEGTLDLHATVVSYLSELNAPDKSAITVEQLLTHRGGFEAYSDVWRRARGRAGYLAALNERPLKYAPGTSTIYSDWSDVVLGVLLERVTGRTLDEFARDRIFAPLGMTSTMYLPPGSLLDRIAPTEVVDSTGKPIHGRVHDENAFSLGGVSGHAGLFGSARDLAVFAQMLLDGGRAASVTLVRPRTVARWTARRERGSSRAYGWDTPSENSSAGHYFSPRSFGHTGFTGTSMWIDPEKDLYVVILSNRVNPTRENERIFRMRRDLADLVQHSVADAPLVNWESQASQPPPAPAAPAAPAARP